MDSQNNVEVMTSGEIITAMNAVRSEMTHTRFSVLVPMQQAFRARCEFLALSTDYNNCVTFLWYPQEVKDMVYEINHVEYELNTLNSENIRLMRLLGEVRSAEAED